MIRKSVTMTCMPVTEKEITMTCMPVTEKESFCQIFWNGAKHFKTWFQSEPNTYRKIKRLMFDKFTYQYVVENCDEQDTEELCQKNPDHKDFIPIGQFQMKHLPLKYQKEEFFKAIQALGHLTVLVKNDSARRLGTGKVMRVVEDKSGYRCPCVLCRSSSKSSEKWWRVVVLTETYLLQDKTEAKNTICRLFYDNHDSESVSVSGFFAVVSHDRPTNCHITCATCDEQLALRLVAELNSCQEWHVKCFDHPMDYNSGEQIVVLVSHPHGGPKKVSIGEIKEEVTLTEGYKTIVHTAPTCPGSAGAYLYTMRPFTSI